MHTEPAGFLLGVDGGGTKTALAVATAAGEVRAEVRVGGTSLSRRASAEVERELAQGVAAVLAQAGARAADCSAVGAGFASAGLEVNRQWYTHLLAAKLPRARVEVATDAEIAWRGASGGADALVVIAGTGSIAWGRRHGRTGRSGGAGPGSDPGSADWIGRQAVAAGLLPPPADDNFAALLPGLREHPQLAPIVEAAGRELAQLLQSCADQLAWLAPVAYPAGGLFSYLPGLGDALARRWPHAWRTPLASPLAGALAMAAALAP